AERDGGEGERAQLTRGAGGMGVKKKAEPPAEIVDMRQPRPADEILDRRVGARAARRKQPLNRASQGDQLTQQVGGEAGNAVGTHEAPQRPAGAVESCLELVVQAGTAQALGKLMRGGIRGRCGEQRRSGGAAMGYWRPLRRGGASHGSKWRPLAQHPSHVLS